MGFDLLWVFCWFACLLVCFPTLKLHLTASETLHMKNCNFHIFFKCMVWVMLKHFLQHVCLPRISHMHSSPEMLESFSSLQIQVMAPVLAGWRKRNLLCACCLSAADGRVSELFFFFKKGKITGTGELDSVSLSLQGYCHFIEQKNNFHF